MRRDRPGRGGKDRNRPDEGRRGAPGQAHASQGHERRPQRGGEAPAFRKASADLVVLYGLHAVREALHVKARKLLALYATATAAERIAPDAATGVA